MATTKVALSKKWSTYPVASNLREFRARLNIKMPFLYFKISKIKIATFNKDTKIVICQGQICWWCNWVYKRYKKNKNCCHAIFMQMDINTKWLFLFVPIYEIHLKRENKNHNKVTTQTIRMRHRVCKKHLTLLLPLLIMLQ